MRIDLNADVGESFGAYTIGHDPGLMTSITSANVAAGFRDDPRLGQLAGDARVVPDQRVGPHERHPVGLVAVAGGTVFAVLAGVRVPRVKLLTYVISGFCAALVGVIFMLPAASSSAPPKARPWSARH